MQRAMRKAGGGWCTLHVRACLLILSEHAVVKSVGGSLRPAALCYHSSLHKCFSAPPAKGPQTAGMLSQPFCQAA